MWRVFRPNWSRQGSDQSKKNRPEVSHRAGLKTSRLRRLTCPRNGRPTWRRSGRPFACDACVRSASRSDGDYEPPARFPRDRVSFSNVAIPFRRTRLSSVVSQSIKSLPLCWTSGRQRAHHAHPLRSGSVRLGRPLGVSTGKRRAGGGRIRGQGGLERPGGNSHKSLGTSGFNLICAGDPRLFRGVG